MANIGKGLYGFYQPLQPNQRQGDEIVEKYMGRMEKKRALDLQEEALKPKKEKLEKYVGEVWERVPPNFAEIVKKIQVDYEGLTVQIQNDTTLSDVEKARSRARLESNPDALNSLFKDYATMVDMLKDPEMVDGLDAATADKMLEDVEMILQGDFTVEIDPKNDNKLKIIDREENEFSIADKGRVLQTYKTTLSDAKAEFGRGNRLSASAGFFNDAASQWTQHHRKTFEEVKNVYQSAFNDIYGRVISEEDKLAGKHGKTQDEADAIMEERYNRDFQKADPVPYPTVTDKGGKINKIFDDRFESKDISDYDNSGGKGIVYAKMDDGSKVQDYKTNYVNPDNGKSTNVRPVHVFYNGKGDIGGIRANIIPNDVAVEEYAASHNMDNDAARTYLTSEIKFLPSNEQGLVDYLSITDNMFEMFPNKTNQATPVVTAYNGAVSLGDEALIAKTREALLDLYWASGNSKVNTEASYVKNGQATNSLFKYVGEKLKLLKGGGTLDYTQF